MVLKPCVLLIRGCHSNQHALYILYISGHFHINSKL